MRRKFSVNGVFALSGAALVCCFLISVFMPTKAVSLWALLGALGGKGGTAGLILFQIRLPRAFAAVICGAGLAVSGLLLQESLNNRLASPGVIGINSGAGLFALLGGLLLPGSAFIRGGLAFLGAMVSVGLVYGISKKAGSSKSTVILSGVAVSSLMSAVSQGIITFFPETVSDKISFTLGGLQWIDSRQLVISALLVAAGIVCALLLSGGIDLFSLGDEAAEGVGLDVKRYRTMTVICAAVLAAASVSLCGLLSFVGLMVPNLVRIATPFGCRRRTALCALWGAGFLLICDCLARTLFYPYELPAGLLLSCIGAPFFIWLLMRRRGERHD